MGLAGKGLFTASGETSLHLPRWCTLPDIHLLGFFYADSDPSHACAPEHSTFRSLRAHTGEQGVQKQAALHVRVLAAVAKTHRSIPAIPNQHHGLQGKTMQSAYGAPAGGASSCTSIVHSRGASVSTTTRSASTILDVLCMPPTSSRVPSARTPCSPL